VQRQFSRKSLISKKLNHNSLAKPEKKKLGRPKFKSKFGDQKYRLPNQKFKLLEDSIKLEKIGKVKLVIESKNGIPRIPDSLAKFLSVTISKNCSGQYFASILVDEIILQKKKTNKSIGLDIGIKTFLTGSDGLVIENQQFFRKSQAELKSAQRRLSRKQKGSSRRKKAKLKVSRIHNKIANQRSTFIHQKSSFLVNEYDILCIEDLNVDGMKRNHKLAKSISDASFGKFYSVLDYKAGWYGKELIKVSRWFPSSKTCSDCGWIDENLILADREFNCQCCGMIKDRDLNASENIHREGLRLRAIAQETKKQALGVTNAIRTQSKRKTKVDLSI